MFVYLFVLSEENFDVVELLAPFWGGRALSEKQKQHLRSSPAFEGQRAKLKAGKFQDRDAFKLTRMFQHALATTTRHQFTSKSGLVLDGPVGASAGQAGIQIMYALDGAKVRCAKVGSRALQHEFEVSETIRKLVLCSSVLRILAFEEVKPDTFALVMPVYPMSVSDALLALPPGASTARDEIALAVALHGLAAVAAFASAGFAHGDLKPSNFMLGDNVVCIDFGTAKKIGGSFSESSIFSVNMDRTVSTEYDLVCLGATLASLQHDEVVIDQSSTRASVLASLQRIEKKYWSPASMLAEACLLPSPTLVELKTLAGRVSDPKLIDAMWPRSPPN